MNHRAHSRDINSNIQDWHPEDEAYWRDEGSAIAWRNLRWSIFALIVAFMVWMLWSSIVVYLAGIRPDFSLSQLYWLTALPMITAGILRIVYSFTVPIFGGRNWTVMSTGVMLVPLGGLYWCFTFEAPYWLYALMALLTGFGGANFASSSSNISFFFPHRLKSIALGFNAAIGNMGVGIIQLLIPYIIAMQLGKALNLRVYVLTDGLEITPQLVFLGLGILVLVATVGSAFRMNNIVPVSASFSEQKDVLASRDCWLMSILYTFTFGSFIGFAAVLPIMVVTLFDRIEFASLAFAGAMLSSFMRPLGHVFAKMIGAVTLTILVFVIMIIGLSCLLLFVPNGDSSGNFVGFMGAYMVVFIGTGLGKGSTTSMIPEIYFMNALKLSRAGELDAASYKLLAARRTATVLGITSAIGTFGALLMPSVFDVAQNIYHDISYGIWFFIGCNAVCLVITWWFYYRCDDDNPLCIQDKNQHLIVVDKPSLHVHI